VRTPPLYAHVIEAAERLDAQGAVVRPLDEARLAADLAAARELGLTSCAIALMHADLDNRHEKRAAELAAQAGFDIVLGSEVSPLPRFIPRAQTAVADAYLSPPVRAYAEGLARGVGFAPLLFMTSIGGSAAVLGFDMGGTSTDVCRYAGALERRETAKVAGIALRTPMLDVETVASGGGSILYFDGLRARVGPRSAGAVPGPAAYGRGGPATVTDANLVLGRIDPAFFRASQTWPRPWARTTPAPPPRGSSTSPSNRWPERSPRSQPPAASTRATMP
jgi:5-oxoprolinase (ATP-hydrolysing)